MEGVAARLGRSSTRYGPAAVFSGPVRRWNKKWVPLSNPEHRRRSSSINGGLLHSSSHLLLYRWTPASSPTDGAGVLSKDASAATPQLEEPPRRKFRYVPIFVIERKEESSPKSSDNTRPIETDQFSRMGQIDSSGTNPDMNNVSTEEAQASYKDQSSSEEGNGADLDLSLGLRAPEGEPAVGPKASKQGEGYVRLAKASSTRDTEKKNATKSVAQNKLKRKAAAADFEMRV